MYWRDLHVMQVGVGVYIVQSVNFILFPSLVVLVQCRWECGRWTCSLRGLGKLAQFWWWHLYILEDLNFVWLPSVLRWKASASQKEVIHTVQSCQLQVRSEESTSSPLAWLEEGIPWLLLLSSRENMNEREPPELHFLRPGGGSDDEDEFRPRKDIVCEQAETMPSEQSRTRNLSHGILVLWKTSVSCKVDVTSEGRAEGRELICRNSDRPAILCISFNC